MNIKNLELVSFLKDGEDWISGKEMIKRAGDSLTNAEELLKYQDKFPEEWRGYYLVFPKVVIRYGGRYVLYLHWYGGQWVVLVDWLDNYFYRYDRFVRSRELPFDSGKLGALPKPMEFDLREVDGQIMEFQMHVRRVTNGNDYTAVDSTNLKEAILKAISQAKAEGIEIAIEAAANEKWEWGSYAETVKRLRDKLKELI